MVLMIIIGIVLLLPGICTVIYEVKDPKMIERAPLANVIFLTITLTIAAGGVALIWNAAFRRR
ncbi:MAG TPA: hypothetical protein VKX28_13695 [Xanthobacteraceae bacterium]|nr:hypothetical protein [Xanthobacteraceae bacterium]